MIEVKFSLELTKNGVQKCIHAKSGEENSRKAVITLTENGKVFDAAGYYVKVYFDNGKHVDTEDDRKLVTVENGCIGFVIPYDLVAEEGERLCEVQISKDNRILYSPVFKVLVEQSLGQHGVSEPVGDVTRYQEVIPDLMSKESVAADDEIAVYTPEDELTTKRKVSSLPFGKKLENEAQIERINASDVDEIKQLSNGKYAKTTDVPTKVSQLTNDKKFVDAETVESMIDGALVNVGGLTEEQAADLAANTEARHIHPNKDILDCFGVNYAQTLPTFKSAQSHKVVTLVDLDSVISRDNSLRVEFDNKLAQHKNENKTVLDNLGENEDGDLTYKGKVVGGTTEKPLVLIEAVVDFATTNIHADFTNCMTIETALIPNNARVKKIEIPDVVNGTDEYIQLEDMVAKDPMGLAAPYFIIYPKNAPGNYSTIAASAVFSTGANNFCEMAGQYAFLDKTIKIHYEIEE